MPKRFTAALCALLTFAAVLAVVPLASPAAAHPQTTTKQYCAFDPFAGNQCWTETVSVAHHHAPANQPCPAGTTGTPPNCLPIPSDNSNHDPDADDSTDDPDTTDPDTTDPDTTDPDTTDSDTTDPDTTDPDTTDPQGGGSDQTQNPCEPWPSCNQSSDPKPETVTTCIFARGPGHKHDGHDCHARTPGHTHGESGSGEDSSGGSAYGMANLFGKAMDWLSDDEKSKLLREPHSALVDAAKSETARNAAEQIFQAAKLAAQQSGAAQGLRQWYQIPQAARIGLAAGGCSALGVVSGGILGLACALITGYAEYFEPQLKPFVTPGTQPDDNGDGQSTSDGQSDDDSTDSTNGQDSGTGSGTGTTESDNESPLSDAEARRLLDQIERDWRARKINANEANEAHNRIRCRQGHWSCRR